MGKSVSIVRRVTALGAVAALAVLGVARSADADTQQYLCSDNTQPIATQADLVDNEAITTKTVVSGTDPTTLSGTYLGAIKNGIAQGEDMLLVRITDSPVVASANGDIRAGIWAGMSGSPVYDSQGRLIGAIAYGLNSSSTNVAGVTPIANMKAVGSSAAAAASPRTVRVTKANGTSAAVDALASAKLTRLKAVPVVSGSASSALATKVAKLAARKSAASNLLSEAGTVTTAAAEATPYQIVAGGNLFVGYSSGDETIGGVGTVTAVCGTTVWGFGHPMDQNGATNLSMAGANTATIIADDTGVTGSYKQVSEIGAPVGTITQDRTSGVKGTIGTLPTGVPVTSWFTGPLGSSQLTSTAYGQANIYLIALYQTYYHAGAALDAGRGHGAIGTAVDYTNSSRTSGTVRSSQYESDTAGVQEDLAYDPAEQVFAFMSAPEDVTIKAVRIRATVGEGFRARNIAGVQVKSGKTWRTVTKLNVKHGQKVTFRTVLKPAVGTGLTTTYSPATTAVVPSAALGRVYLEVSGGYGFYDEEDCDEDGICFYDGGSSSWSGFVGALQNGDHNDGIYAALEYGTRKDDDVMKNLKLNLGDGLVQGGTAVTLIIKK